MSRKYLISLLKFMRKKETHWMSKFVHWKSWKQIRFNPKTLFLKSLIWSSQISIKVFCCSMMHCFCTIMISRFLIYQICQIYHQILIYLWLIIKKKLVRVFRVVFNITLSWIAKHSSESINLNHYIFLKN